MHPVLRPVAQVVGSVVGGRRGMVEMLGFAAL
jgi:hypothetical protein